MLQRIKDDVQEAEIASKDSRAALISLGKQLSKLHERMDTVWGGDHSANGTPRGLRAGSKSSRAVAAFKKESDGLESDLRTQVTQMHSLLKKVADGSVTRLKQSEGTYLQRAAAAEAPFKPNVEFKLASRHGRRDIPQACDAGLPPCQQQPSVPTIAAAFCADAPTPDHRPPPRLPTLVEPLPSASSPPAAELPMAPASTRFVAPLQPTGNERGLSEEAPPLAPPRHQSGLTSTLAASFVQ